MMEWMDGGGVRGSGFSVRTGFNFAVYREGNSVMQFTIKRGFRDSQHLVIVPSNAFVRWESGIEDNSPKDQQRMRENFIAAMRFAGCLVE